MENNLDSKLSGLEENKAFDESRSTSVFRTFEDDIAKAMKDGKGSALGIVLAEQKRKEEVVEFAQKKKSNVWLLIVGIIMFVFSLLTIGYIVYQKYGPSILADSQKGTSSFVHPIMRSDENTLLGIDDVLPKNGITESILYKIGGIKLSTKLITLVVPTIKIGENTVMAEAKDIFPRISVHAPDSLSRSLATSTAIGIYSSDTAEPFIVLKTTSYEGAFSGMLGWEDFMSDDLYTLLGVTLPKTAESIVPSLKPKSLSADIAIPKEAILLQQDFLASSTDKTATSTATSTSRDTASSSELMKEEIIPEIPKININIPEIVSDTKNHDINKFVDRTIKNKDMRVIQDENGKIYFLYGFANRNTIIITTSVDAFFEVASRLR